MAILYRLLLCLTLLIDGAKLSVAQSIKVNIWRDTITTAAGTTFTNRLTITNNSAVKQRLEVLVRTPSSLQLLSNTPRQLSLIAGEAGIVPIKGLVNRQLKSPVNEVIVQVNDSVGHLLKETTFRIVVPQKPQSAISLYSSDQTIILYSGTELARLPLRLIHHRDRRETFAINLISLPTGADRRAFPMPVTLSPDQDTTVVVLIKPSRYWSASTPYQLVLTVRDSAGAVAGNAVFKVVVAVASKRFTKADPSGEGNYGASMAFTKLSNNQWTREGRVWGQDSVGKARMDFQIQYLDYASDQYRQLQNSFISFRTEKTALRFGSLFDYHELPLYGLGLKVNYMQADHQWTVWAVNAKSNWLDQTTNIASGNTVSVRYDRQLARFPGSSWSLSSSYFTQSANNRTGYLNFASFRLNFPERHLLEVLAGQSAESARLGTDRMKTVGWAGQINYTYQSPAFTWQVRSYISSPVYSGFQKGGTLVNSSLFWKPRSTLTLLARLNHIYYNQVLFSPAGDQYRRVFGNTIAELGLRYEISRLTFGLRPYWYQQTDFSNQFSPQAYSYRLSPSLSYRHRNYQRFDFSYDIGRLYNRAAPQSGLLSQRITAQAGFGPFSFFGYWQQGPYYLNDFRMADPAHLVRASLTPLIDFALFNRRLIGTAGLNFLYDGFAGGTQAIAVGRVRYDISPSLWLRLEGNKTPYSQLSELAISQYRLEMTKQFGQLNLNAKGRLRLHFFDDANGNGNREPGEKWLDSLLVTVDDNTLMTNAKGTISYQNLPPGLHTVTAISAGHLGDPVQYYEKIMVGQSVDRIIPIRQTYRVSGVLHCKTNVYDNKPCDFDRFRLAIKRGDETISATTPLPDGTFSMHLLPGDYTLLLHDNVRGITVKNTTFTVGEAGQHPGFDWTVDGSTRSVEIKRFKAN